MKQVLKSDKPETLLWHETHNISKFKPVFIGEKHWTWRNDAKNLIRIYVRCTKAKCIHPKMIKPLAKWAELLLFYLPAYGSKDNPLELVTWYDLVKWMVPFLKEISAAQNASDFYGEDILQFYRKEITPGELLKISHCAITHEPLSKDKTYCKYHTVFDQKTIESEYIASDTFSKLIKKVKKAVKRHDSRHRHKLYKSIQQYANSSRNRSYRARVGSGFHVTETSGI